MRTSRRTLFKLGALAAASAALPSVGTAAATRPIARADKPLRILILGGTGFTGPFQVRYALARGHRVTLFNRGKTPSPEWPGEVEQLHGDRNTGDLKALEGREWDVCIDNPTTLPFWVRDAGQALKGRVGTTCSYPRSPSTRWRQARHHRGRGLAQYRGRAPWPKRARACAPTWKTSMARSRC